MEFLIETTDFKGEVFKIKYIASGLDINNNVYAYLRRMIQFNLLYYNKRQYMKVNEEIVWDIKTGFTENWLKKEFEFNLKC